MVCSDCICEAVNVAFKLNTNEIKITTNKMNLGYWGSTMTREDKIFYSRICFYLTGSMAFVNSTFNLIGGSPWVRYTNAIQKVICIMKE